MSSTSGHWKESAFETVSLFLAVVGGIWEETLLKDNPTLLYTIQGILIVGTFLVLLVVAKVRKPHVFKLLRFILKGANWATALIAGNTFAYAYSLIVQLGILGILGVFWLVIYVSVVVFLIDWIKVFQDRVNVREKEANR